MKTMAQNIKPLFLALAALNLSCQAWTVAPINGGIAQVTLPDSDSRPQASYLGHPVLIEGQSPHWQAIVGIPLDRPAGTEYLEVSSPQAARLAFTISHKDYPEQHITLRNLHMVNPSAAELQRIHQELSEERQDFAIFDGRTPALADMHLPVQPTALDSAFGLRRFFNGEERAPHSGLDLQAQEGQAVYAPLGGRVLLSRDLYFNGGTVIIDHGQGLISMYCHLSRIEVAAGQNLAAGAELGRVGHTGRATGPHLHWSVSLNDVRIDPSLLLDAGQRQQLTGHH